MDTSTASGICSLTYYRTRSRWTSLPDTVERGRGRRRRRLLAKCEATGLHRCRKIELTYNRKDQNGDTLPPEYFFDQSKAKRHVGEFMRRLRRRYPHAEYFKASEFQQAGYVHFHLILCNVPDIPKLYLDSLWGHGHTWITRVSPQQVGYVSKGLLYASKGVDELPAFMCQRSSLTRLNSTSRHFYLDEPKRTKPAKRAKDQRYVPTIGEVRSRPDRYVRAHLCMVLAETGEEYRATLRDGDESRLVHRLIELGFAPAEEFRDKPEVRSCRYVPSLVSETYCGEDCIQRLVYDIEDAKRP